MREDIPSYLRDIVVATLHRCASLSLYSTCTVCTFSRSLIDRDTVTADDRCSCLISLLTTSM